MLKVGIVGAGFMGTTHAAGWTKLPVQLMGVHSLDANRAHKLTEQYPSKEYDDVDTLIQDVDIVDICTPTYLHYETVLKAAKAGKHIICEKPLARTVAQARAMIEACKQANVKLLVAHVVRFFPEYEQAKAIVERGEIGHVAVVRLTRCSARPIWSADNWIFDVEKSGGMMLDLMIHDFDYARWVAGAVESVFAKSAHGGAYGLAILRHKNGALSNIEGGWAYPPPLFRTALEIAGSEGLIEHPAGSSTAIGIHLKPNEDGASPDGKVPRSPLLEDPYTTQLKHFHNVITGKDVMPRVTAEDGLAALQIALAAMQSAQTGKRVTIEEVL